MWWLYDHSLGSKLHHGGEARAFPDQARSKRKHSVAEAAAGALTCNQAVAHISGQGKPAAGKWASIQTERLVEKE